MSDAASPAPTDPDAELLDALCRELAEAADAVGEAARHASELALGARLPAAALGRRHARSRHGWRTLLRTLTDPAGLGWAPRGRGVARAGWFAGILTGRESLAVSLAVCGLKARIRAASAERPDLLDDPDCAAILRAVNEDRQAAAARVFRRLMRDRGAERAFALLSQSFADLFAWNALTDANPFNDHAGWQVATGRAVPAAPLLGLGAAVRAFFDRDRDRDRYRDQDRYQDPYRDRYRDGDQGQRPAPAAPYKGCVHTLGLIGTGGILLVQPWRSR
ncbi:hypothetical protein [Streptomyces sp. NRRL F-2747]|uniref:hypothetical protein n=1 Tax=Streptomyces sp. NRRL F-2747 TaxID=1463843 RepID=UPI00068FE7D9|nr:hypothetical protein [Streptomyces sp. NRRL F-2747]